MIVGVGTDILAYQQINPDFLTEEDAFFNKVFSKAEQEVGRNREDAYRYFCGRFCAKEAIFKTFGISGDFSGTFSEISIIDNEEHVPVVELQGAIKHLAIAKHISKIHISISYEETVVIAFAIAENDSVL